MSAASPPPPPPLSPKLKREADLLPPAPQSDRPLFFVVAIIVALACAAAVSARAAWSAAAEWTAGLDGAMTIEVRPNGAESGQAAAERAAAAAAAAPGVASARVMTRDELDALLAPWFGKEGAPAEAPLPGLVDVRLDAVAPATASDLDAALRAAGVDAVVDDHGSWANDLRRAAGAARTMALAAFTLLITAAVAVTSFATRASLAARADVVDVLHLVGARDQFIASEFTRRFLGLGVRAGVLGAALALAGALAAHALTQGASADFLPRFRFARADVIILALAPLASATVAAFTARETVLHALKRLY